MTHNLADAGETITRADDRYLAALQGALHTRNVTGTAAGDVLAEVETHIRHTGEDPEVAFGKPGEYAAAVAEALRPQSRSFWLPLVARTPQPNPSGDTSPSSPRWPPPAGCRPRSSPMPPPQHSLSPASQF